MGFTVGEQMKCLLCSLLCGLVIGAAYDVLRIIRVYIFTGKVSVFICDFLFMLIFAFITAFFSMAYSNGYVRYFTVIGELCGFFIFRITLGRFSLAVWGFVIGKTKKIFRKILIKSKKIAKKVLQGVYTLLYNNLKKITLIKHKRKQN